MSIDIIIGTPPPIEVQAGTSGPKGQKGDKGDNGYNALTCLGSVPTIADLPDDLGTDDAMVAYYVVEDHGIWTWTGTVWEYVIPLFMTMTTVVEA